MLQRILLLLSIPLCTFAQGPGLLHKKVSLQAGNITVEQALQQIGRQYNVPFSYVKEYLPSQPISIQLHNEPLKTLLTQLLAGSGISFEETGSQIVLSQGASSSIYTQTIQGIITDKTLQAPLRGVTVLLPGIPGKGAVTDEHGRFQIRQVPLGRHDILFRSLGHKPLKLGQVLVIAGRQTVLPVMLEENVFETKEVRVTGQRTPDKTRSINPLSIVSTRILSVEEANRFAGSRSDPSRMAANYAGVVNANDQNNDIIVRGNNPFGVLWRLEGIDIPNPNHYTYINTSGGVFSVLNNNLLANSDFLTGAFPAEYGNKIASVFDIRLRNGNAEKHEFNGQLGLSGLEFNAEGPLDKKRGVTYVAGYRFLNFDFLQRLGLNININGVPRLQDLTFKLNVPDQRGGAFTLFGLGGKSRIGFTETMDDLRNSPRIVTGGFNSFISDVGVLGAKYNHYFSANTQGQLLASVSGSKIYSDRNLRFSDEETVKDSEGDFREKSLTIGYNLSHKFSKQHFLKGGLTYSRKLYKYYLQILGDDTSMIHVLKLNDLVPMKMLQGFVHWQYTPAPSFTFNTGLHYQQLFFNNQKALEPRFSAQWSFLPKQRLTAGYGLHHQTQPVNMYINRNYNQQSKTYTPANKDVKFTGSHHFVLGYENAFRQWFRLKAEAYYQGIFQAPVQSGPGFYSALNEGLSYNDYVADTLLSIGKGRNYGVELTLERFLFRRYYFLVTATLYNSRYQASNGGWYNTAFNGNYIVNAAGGAEFRVGKKKQRQNTLAADLRIVQAGNKRTMPVDVEASKKAGVLVFEEDGFYKERLKDYSRADVKVSYRINLPRATHSFFVAVDNVLNYKNVLGKDYSYYEQRVKTDYQLGIFPYAGYKVEF